MMTSHSDKRPGWQFWIDRGGTFTDIVARAPDGHLISDKLLSEQPGFYADAAAEGIRRLLQKHAPPDARVDAIRIGTTVATNALLEGNSPPTALMLTAGFEDLLDIADQRRDALFALHITKRRIPVASIQTTGARMDSNGLVLRAPDEQTLHRQLKALRDDGIEHLAISLLHGWRNPAHEIAIAALARTVGFTNIVCGSEVAPLRGYLARTETTLLDAWLTPVVHDYLEGLRRALANVCDCDDIAFMQSNGGLIDADEIRGKDAVLSGPAGGIIGIARCAERSQLARVVGFDMGGTSTDVCLWQGELEQQSANRIGQYRLNTPMLRLDTIAAGGGSILRWQDQRFQVGPQSAGAAPGPAAYGRGGPLTLTDANILVGRLPHAFVPPVFGRDGCQPLDITASRAAIDAMFETTTGHEHSAHDQSSSRASIAEGFIAVAVDNMASAIRHQALQRGEDVRRFTLAAFGGASGQLVCRVADALQVDEIWIHPFAGVFSALGIGLADRVRMRDVAIGLPLQDSKAQLQRHCDEARRQCTAKSNVTLTFEAALQVTGSDTVLNVALDEPAAMRQAFNEAHMRRFGMPASGDPHVASLRVSEIIANDTSDNAAYDADAATPTAVGHSQLFVDGKLHDADIFQLDDIGTTPVTGPAILTASNTTVVVDAHWRALRDDHGALRLTRTKTPRTTTTMHSDDAVMLEIFNNRFTQVAEQMGRVLESTAHSVNIKERLDFSCALFDDCGRLIANAPHMPVHLGSMGASVAHVLADATDLRHGDVFLLNSPFAGGTHLPDITAISPWCDEAGKLRFFVASRAHHADIGGITPGSMPATSRHIDEEGVLLDNVRVMRDGDFDEAGLRARLGDHRWPARNIDRNINDVRAQIASLHEGVRQIERMLETFGIATVTQHMQRVRDNATDCVRQELGRLTSGSDTLSMDNGLVIRVAIRVDKTHGTAVIDFSGTSAQHDGNFNAPLSVTRAATLYVLRTLVDRDIPLNDGCLEPVEIIVPEGCFLNPAWPAAVVAGNVETSQCVTNALYAALGIMADAQGTMNNLTFGNDRVQYYETIAGGTGAGNGFGGADGVQSHMTNSRMTDPEVLESRLPVRVEAFTIRRNSGGGGEWRGGDGVVRQLRFLEPVECSILSGFRRIAPRGLAGGDDAECGINTVRRADGSEYELDGVSTATLDCGDQIIVATPGGGGFGRET